MGKDEELGEDEEDSREEDESDLEETLDEDEEEEEKVKEELRFDEIINLSLLNSFSGDIIAPVLNQVAIAPQIFSTINLEQDLENTPVSTNLKSKGGSATYLSGGESGYLSVGGNGEEATYASSEGVQRITRVDPTTTGSRQTINPVGNVGFQRSSEIGDVGGQTIETYVTPEKKDTREDRLPFEQRELDTRDVGYETSA